MRILTFCGALALSSLAWAVADDFSISFPTMVCSDGWVACLDDGDDFAVDSVKDSAGVFHRADARVSFFTFERLPNFSPFGDLSAYDDKPVAVAEPAEEIREVVTTKREPIRKKDPVVKPTIIKEPAAEPEAIPEPEVVQEPEEVPVPEVIPEPEVVQEPEAIPEPEVNLDDSSCSDLIILEGNAMIGSLTGDQKRCLEDKIKSSGSLTDKRNMSLLLINNAENSKKYDEWGELVDRHLQRIDQSDPALCMKYAWFLSKKGVGKSSKVIKWSETALENKHVWKGADYKKNVYLLYQLRANAANSLWSNAEKKLVDKRSPENQAKADKYRGQTKNFAREWLDYARSSSQNVKNPMALCVSATQGDMDFCK